MTKSWTEYLLLWRLNEAIVEVVLSVRAFSLFMNIIAVVPMYYGLVIRVYVTITYGEQYLQIP